MSIMSVRSVVPVILAFAGVLAPAWAAAQTLTLTVPHRGAGAMQTASTTIEFDPSMAPGALTIAVRQTVPSAGTPVTVTVPLSSCVGAACESMTLNTSNGDEFFARRIPGTNRAQLELTYTASFGANYCAYTAGAGAKTYEIVLTGFTFDGASGVRTTSFMAPSNESCDIPYSRVPSQRPTLAGLNRLGRMPLNVVMVLDRSGSMDWTIPEFTDKRWDAMRQAALNFTQVWDVVGAPPPAAGTVSSEGNAEDRLGLVFFGDAASESPLDGASFFKSRGAGLAPWLAAVQGAIPMSTPGGWTALGAGVTNGRSRLQTVKKVIGDTAILLFTDGEQNRPPCIIHQGEVIVPTVKPYPNNPSATYTDECHVPAGIPLAPLTLNGQLLAKDVVPRGPIFTIGLGEGGMAASALLLDRIAQETAGQSRYPLTSATVSTSFMDTLVENLKGGTVSMVERAIATMPAGTNASAPMMVPIDPSLTRVVFAMGWDGASREVALEIRRPDGMVVTPPLNESTTRSRVAGINLPTDGPSGTWQVRVIRQDQSTAPLNYHVSAYGVESRLSARITESARLGTGKPLTIVAEVGWNDAGLADLPAGAIVATIERPNENLGTLLSPTLADSPGPLFDDVSPLMVKFQRLAETQGLLDRIQPRPLAQKVTLVSVGDGRYEGTFNGVNVGGQYRVGVDFEWNDPRTGAIHRRHTAERQVQVLPSAISSPVEVVRGRDYIQILVTPRDDFGNYVGPGFPGQFNVQVNGATVPVSNADLTGRYVIRLPGVGSNDPRVKIEYAGQTLRDAPLSQIGTGAGGANAVWFGFGATFPGSDFAATHTTGIAFNVGVERALTTSTSIEGTFGWHQFRAKSGVGDVDVTQLAANGKWYFKPAPIRPYVTAGLGIYTFDAGTHFGVSGGIGVQGEIMPRWSLDGRATFIGTTNNAPSSPYVTLQLGLRYEF